MEKFCNDMETTPVGVIVGLFQAISQKLPAFTDWETHKHHHLLNSNPDVCNTMTEVRQHVTQYGMLNCSEYLLIPLLLTSSFQNHTSAAARIRHLTATTLTACRTNLFQSWSFERIRLF